MRPSDTIEGALARHLRTVAGVSELVANRSFEDDLPENESLPAITVESNGFGDWGTLDAPPQDGTSQIVVDCLAKSAQEAAQVRAAVIQAVNGAREVVWDEIAVQSCELRNIMSDRPKQDWLQGKAFCKRLVLEIMHDL